MKDLQQKRNHLSLRDLNVPPQLYNFQIYASQEFMTERERARRERDLHAVDGEEAAENAFFEASAEDDDVVFFVHTFEILCRERNDEKIEERERDGERGEILEGVSDLCFPPSLLTEMSLKRLLN